jgi:hypothetical protein
MVINFSNLKMLRNNLNVTSSLKSCDRFRHSVWIFCVINCDEDLNKSLSN